MVFLWFPVIPQTRGTLQNTTANDSSYYCQSKLLPVAVCLLGSLLPSIPVELRTARGPSTFRTLNFGFVIISLQGTTFDWSSEEKKNTMSAASRQDLADCHRRACLDPVPNETQASSGTKREQEPRPSSRSGVAGSAGAWQLGGGNSRPPLERLVLVKTNMLRIKFRSGCYILRLGKGIPMRRTSICDCIAKLKSPCEVATTSQICGDWIAVLTLTTVI